MENDKLLVLADIFYSLAKKSEEKSIDSILKNLDNLETFSARKKFSEDNLSHLSSGSSRITYLTPQKTVIKLAKNDRGLAQNKAESNAIKSKYVNSTLKKSKDYYWIEVQFL